MINRQLCKCFMNVKKSIDLNEKSHIIASNSDRFLVADENVGINDIYSYAIIIDKEGNIIDAPQLIGTIIKFGYWKPENFYFSDLKNKIYIQKIITDALIGFGVGENFSNGLLKSKIINSKEYLKNAFIIFLPILLFCIFGLVDNEYEAINNVLSISFNNEIMKMGIYIYTSFLKVIVENRDKFKAFEYVKNINYSKLYSLETQREFYAVFNGEYKSINKNEINQSKYIIDSFKSIFYCILSNDNYEQTILTSTRLKNVDDITVAMTGLIAGIIYGEKDIPIDWIIDLESEEYLRDLASDFSENILLKINDKNGTGK